VTVLLFFAIPLIVAVSMVVRRVRRGRSPVTLFGGAALSWMAMGYVWTYGMFSTALYVEKQCVFQHHVRFDAEYYSEHAEEFKRLFPLHEKCNADYDMVPAWVNPAIVVLGVLGVVLLVAQIASAIVHYRKELASS
jgi:hypothetical protein